MSATAVIDITQADGFRVGVFENMPFEEYARVPALNGSSIVHMRRSPMQYRHAMDNPKLPTQEMLIGTEIHRLVLEPEREKELAVWGLLPEQKVRNGRVWDAFREANKHLTICTKAEFERIGATARAALRNVPIRKYATADGVTEVCLFWRHPHTKRRMKARIDKLIPETHTIADLKSTFDSRPFRFGRTAYSLGYVMKMAHYWDGYRTLIGREPEVKLLAIETNAPHESVVYHVPRELLLLGLEERDNLIERLEECEREDRWPAAEQDEVILPIPAWLDTASDTELGLEM